MKKGMKLKCRRNQCIYEVYHVYQSSLRCVMSSPYPNQSSNSFSTSNQAFYPHSMAVLVPGQSNFQAYSQVGLDQHSFEARSAGGARLGNESLGSPSQMQNTSNVGVSQINDLSSTSPYRVASSTTNDPVTSSPYRQVYMETSAAPVNLMRSSEQIKPASIEIPNGTPGIIGMQGNVIYSDRPLTSADFESMMMPGQGNFQVPNMQNFPQMVPSMPFGGIASSQFSPSFPQFQSNFMSSVPLTPRMVLGASSSLTPRGFGAGSMPVSTGTQMGLTPRSYQEQMSAMMMPGPMPADPMLQMFAETFRNQCIAMSQYYASHPEERIESPKASQNTAAPIEAAPAPALTRPEAHHHYFMKRRPQPSLKTVHDHENYDTANQTPNGSEPVKNHNDAVLDLLDRLADGEEEEHTQNESNKRVDNVAPVMGSPIIRNNNSRSQSWLQRFGCGSLRMSS